MPEPSSTDDADDGVVNLSGYRFVALEALQGRRDALAAALGEAGVLGTVLLAPEGINLALAGTARACEHARTVLAEDPKLGGLWLKESLSAEVPFSRLKVRVRDEIIAFEGAESVHRRAARPAAPSLPPETLAHWLATGRDVTLLDTRNTYEVDAGSFAGAVTLDIESFRDFTDAARAAIADGRLDPTRPLVTFCTGGVRCEKAAPWLLEQGFEEVWQIEGGVLGWFERLGERHWDGDCFVFDDRVTITPALEPTGARLCPDCHRAVSSGASCPCGAAEPTDGQGSRTAIDTV